ncbi:MazG-like family protein [Streptomyces nigrescens]
MPAPLTPATEPVGADGFTPRERVWLDQTIKHMAELNDLLAERGSPRRYGIGPEAPPTEPDADTAGLWQAASTAVAWLNTTNVPSDHETAMRLMKLTEEAGEVMQAYIGLQGQNPRKGQTHTADDVAAELCDVILTAAVALHEFTDQPAATLDHHMRRVNDRMKQPPSDHAN